MELQPFINDHNNTLKILTHPFVRHIFYNILEVPLMELYFNGPGLYGYGFWSGKTTQHICAELTGVPEDHWINNTNVCLVLIQRQFEAFLVFIYFIIYILIIYILLIKLCSR